MGPPGWKGRQKGKRGKKRKKEEKEKKRGHKGEEQMGAGGQGSIVVPWSDKVYGAPTSLGVKYNVWELLYYICDFHAPAPPYPIIPRGAQK